MSEEGDKYEAEAVVGITGSVDYVFYDLVDIVPAYFDIKKRNPHPPLLRINRLAIYKGIPMVEL